ncbi:hypothetical protein G7L40_20060 [Paenibacillus polymyxa]|uniref:Uncharacterized protein n=1 Tax=Paenibacillus polymyxa TaxID=1406 RepID=A0A378Y1Y2_PAEPO|nr:hypothetical protein [Paenibacillus polymyxa]MBE7896216.1 hypothetical protein [Paenibacillus polymyxa]MBG9765850.1 hypothetical protein [Paenibacillus polymyxa]MCC3256745.1 hypothetical protein [Paenibacillus polymyxa]QPK54767.1 hypothetical protein G7035_20100 [Paenibacillus polymyxa]QPK59858.1 hypothetical protein G7L40_20060 [Paenibacillus polymyxa]
MEYTKKVHKQYYQFFNLSKKIARLSNWIWSIIAVGLLFYLIGFFKLDLQLMGYSATVAVGMLVVKLIEWISGSIGLYLGTKHPELRYMQGADLNGWYDSTYDYNLKQNWLTKAVENLSVVGVNFSSKKIFSPSANKGKYEYKLSQQYPDSNIVATDICVPNEHIQTSDNIVYLTEPNDALKSAECLSKMGVQKVDLIWDIKGALWHTKDISKFNSLLETYLDILSDNGAVIIDAYDFSSKYILNLKPKNKGYKENSTYTVIKKRLKKVSWFEEAFEVVLTGEGEAKMAVLFKKMH